MGDPSGSKAYTQEQRDAFRGLAAVDLEFAILELLRRPAAFAEPDAGDETEFVITSANGYPLGVNKYFLAMAQQRNLPVVGEVLTHQGEINGGIWPFSPSIFTEYQAEMTNILLGVQDIVRPLGGLTGLTGALMTLTREHTRNSNMTEGNPRFPALDQNLREVLGPIDFGLWGPDGDEVSFVTGDVCLEGAGTSVQTHRTCRPDELAMLINAAQMGACLQVAATEGSPLLFGNLLWRESRHEILRQSLRGRTPLGPCVETPGGFTWAQNLSEVLGFCLQPRFDILLAEKFRTPPDEIMHWKLANGQLHAWYRPTIYSSGKCGYEDRVKSAGATLGDQAVNHALSHAISAALAKRMPGWIKAGFPYHLAVSNLRAASQRGLNAVLDWPDRQGRPEARQARDIVLELLAEAAPAALSKLGTGDRTAARMLKLAEARVRSGQTTAQWLIDGAACIKGESREHVMSKLTMIYLDPDHSNQGLGPRLVHQWDPAAASPLAA
jgi:hypothetical protein